jgi:hypothetical protein
MRTHTRQPRDNRTIPVDFQNEAPYYQLLGDGKAFVECILACVLALGFPRKTQGHLRRRWVPDPSLALCPCPLGRPHHLAYSVSRVQSGLHGPATLCLAVPPDATGGRP